jgi:hypothetical protein
MVAVAAQMKEARWGRDVCVGVLMGRSFIRRATEGSGWKSRLRPGTISRGEPSGEALNGVGWTLARSVGGSAFSASSYGEMVGWWRESPQGKRHG